MEWKYPLLRNWYRGPLDPRRSCTGKACSGEHGLACREIPRTLSASHNQGALQILDQTNKVINGMNYDMTPEEVIQFCEEFEAHIELITQGDR